MQQFCKGTTLEDLLTRAYNVQMVKLKPSAAFELHVSWLLGMFGLSTVILGNYEHILAPDTPVQRASVDILAASQQNRLSDAYAVLLNGLWGFGLNRGAINHLSSVTARARQKNKNHGLVGLVDPIIGEDASWWSVASNIRNESQHVDATTILIIPYGRGATDPPYLDSRLFPRANMLSRRLDNFCPWLKDQAFQVVEDMSRVFAAAPISIKNAT